MGWTQTRDGLAGADECKVVHDGSRWGRLGQIVVYRARRRFGHVIRLRSTVVGAESAAECRWTFGGADEVDCPRDGGRWCRGAAKDGDEGRGACVWFKRQRW